ncbi:hypothetical protein GCM10011575_31860 [Microlunatus endophyticus]|uniref:Putative zinc-finger domain-containing protein n=1 Tax=Microlunatus endophyticus TaxID=1716077 RepID=A0A917SC27_9ACTN|nr:hypothetical protein [Microlunatus endophyticus]GGL71045.1 hypothetical protein GCM10011575_31860 [Microlunatus endophyticus]
MSTDAGQPPRADEHVEQNGRGDHIGLEELADRSEDLLSPERTAEIDAHLAGCDQCRSDAAALAEVQGLLADAPATSMPDDVFARLQETIEDQQRGRASEQSRHATGNHPGPSRSIGGHSPYVDDLGHPNIRGGGRFPKPNIAEHFTETKHSRRSLRTRFAGGAVAAALLASGAGFGGYVLSAASGANEPPNDQPIVATDTESLASSAASAAASDLDAYRFTKAWRCAREVTDGKITGIRSAVLKGEPGYLVFLESGPNKHAVFITGCDSGDPTAGPTVHF